jgi:branched-chain amino acid transport system ATP-binding protein
MSNGLDLIGVCAGYGPVEALHGVTIECPLGSMVMLLGRNGAGKSSAVRVAAGIVPASAGAVRWRNADITAATPDQRCRAGITTIPDDANVFTRMSVADNLRLFGDGADPGVVYEAFPQLADKARQRAGTLSGGERQMLALGRALLRPGAALLLDEADRGLSQASIARLHAVLEQLRSPDRTIVVVEQYSPSVVERADLVYVLSRGDVVWHGPAAEAHHHTTQG